MENNTRNARETVVKGSAWMTFGSIVSRILGTLYIVPWYAWMGSHGSIANVLTARSYNIYSLLIIISTAGIPDAVAGQVAEYNTLNEHDIGCKLSRRGLTLMAFLGVVCAAIMYSGAPILATDNIIGALLHGTENDPRQVTVMRSLSHAVLIIPILSIMRGYLQGYADMMPPAMSRFVERLARVSQIPLTAYIIMQIQHDFCVHTAIQSSSAAAIGAVLGILLLAWFLYRRRSELNVLIEHPNHAIKISTTGIFWEVINRSIPFTVTDSGIILFQLTDQYTFHSAIVMFVHASSDQIELWYTLFGLNVNRLTMIIMLSATVISITAISLLSGAHTRRDYASISNQIENTLELFLFVMIPASLGMVAIAAPTYTVSYDYDPLGPNVLYLSSFTAISLGFFMVLMAISQGLSENGLVIKYLVLGIIIKFAVQLPMIQLLKVYGPFLATDIGLVITIRLPLKHLKIRYKYNSGCTPRRFIGTAIFLMAIFVVVTEVADFGGKLTSPERRPTSLILVILAVAVGGILYAFLSVKFGLAQRIIEPKVNRVLARLHIRI